MADHSGIEWTDATWTPIAGCSLASPGCTNCYAMRRVAPRLANNPATPHYAGTVEKAKSGRQEASSAAGARGKAKYVWTGRIGIASDKVLTAPLRWKAPRMIFVNSVSDLFHEDVPDGVIDRIFAVMALCPQHIFQVLTKRSGRMREYLATSYYTGKAFERIAEVMLALVNEQGIPTRRETCELHGIPWHQPRSANDWWPLPNVWLGVSVEDQARADERIPNLLATPAAVRWISAEPLLEGIDVERWLQSRLDVEAAGLGDDPMAGFLLGQAIADGRGDGPMTNRLDWVVCGGESGTGARPMHPDWARSLRDQCAAAGVPFLFKQWGEWAPGECATHAQTRTEQTAIFYGESWPNSGWVYRSVTVGESEEMHLDDEPDVWRFGRTRTGRLLDGMLHDAYPAGTPGSARGREATDGRSPQGRGPSRPVARAVRSETAGRQREDEK